mmetsp:Transcript_12628/g.31039  ORF Transcript_12628/g.31039 Transcript_12628/m.31039 type:complete len:739 (-) Transcript_12628:113-2329(-)
MDDSGTLPADVRWEHKLMVVLVGLPARGKSFISHKLVNFLCWSGIKSEIFNAGKTRRKLMSNSSNSSSFFDSRNKSNLNIREEIAMKTLDSALDWLENEGDVAIFDATNSTRARRYAVSNRCYEKSEYLNVLFIESICNNKQVLKNNKLCKIRNSPDYKGWTMEKALGDLEKRIENYEKAYEPVQDDSLSYVKLIDLQSKVVCNNIYGSIANMIVRFLMCIHTLQAPIYLCRAASFPKATHKAENSRPMSPTSRLHSRSPSISFAPDPPTPNSDPSTQSEPAESSSPLPRAPSISVPPQTVLRSPALPPVPTPTLNEKVKLLPLAASPPQTIMVENPAKNRSKSFPAVPRALPTVVSASRGPLIQSPPASPRRRSLAPWRDRSEKLSRTPTPTREDISELSLSSSVLPSNRRKLDVGTQRETLKIRSLSNLMTKSGTPDPQDEDGKADRFAKDLAEFIKTKNREWANSSDTKLTPRLTATTKPAKGISRKGRRSLTNLAQAELLSSEVDKFSTVVYTSGMRRSIMTAMYINTDITIEPALNSMNTGICNGMSLSEMKSKMPEEIAKWRQDPFYYRFPSGESQQDLVIKLQSFIQEIEGHVRPVLVISHISTLQVLYGYFLGHRFIQDRYHKLNIPYNIVIELTPSQYGWNEKRYTLGQANPLTSIAKNKFEGVSVYHNTNFYEECFRQSEEAEEQKKNCVNSKMCNEEFLEVLYGSQRTMPTISADSPPSVETKLSEK